MASADARARLTEAAIVEKLAVAASGDDASVRADVALGIGDDGAVLQCPPGTALVAVLDTLVEGVHFPAGTAAQDLGFRSLAVNLSDLAAMGAEPAWAMLSLSMPAPDAAWVDSFIGGFFGLARDHGVMLVGGDTVRGPLAVTVQAMGFVPVGEALIRGGAKVGDLLYVSGTPGDAAAGLAALSSGAADPGGNAAVLARRFNRPTPRIGLGLALRSVASAAIDVSDGLSVDAGRLAAASGVAVELTVDDLPLSEALVSWVGIDEARQYALSGGDDYELLFSVAHDRVPDTSRLAALAGCPVTQVGRIAPGVGVACRLDGKPYAPRAGFDHFSTTG